jgi:ubiquinone/menaquinone biosynthesis C-methylase UbiE
MNDHHYLIRGGLQGRERLRVLGRVMRPTTLPLLERAGVTSGLRCLDVGCGGGDVTFDLASLVGPTGSVVGIDVDATKIGLARSDAEQAEVGNVELRVGDLADGLGDAEYDVVYARFVLTHLRDPAAGLAGMVAALVPGGRLVVEDIDFRGSFCHPVHPSFERYNEIYTLTALAGGGDPHIATALPLMLTDAGLERVQPLVVQPASMDGDVKLLPPLTLENIKDPAVRHGVATAEEVDRLVEDLYAVAADPRTFVGNPRMVQVVGEKPGAGL